MVNNYKATRPLRDKLTALGYEPVNLREKFNCQKWHAINRRQLEWNLTFDEWIDIWLESGKLHLRGRGKGKYTMGRYGDTGAYEVGNVYIEAHETNSVSKITMAKCKKPVVYKNVQYDSVNDAIVANKITGKTLRTRCLDPKILDSYYI